MIRNFNLTYTKKVKLEFVYCKKDSNRILLKPISQIGVIYTIELN